MRSLSPRTRRPADAADDWASYGEWIQIYSRQSFAEAVDLAGAFRREFPGTFVFRYDNGWYVGAIGPYPFGKARPERDRLVRFGRIPTDSLVNRGDRFVDLVWGASPERPSTASRPSDEAFALDAAEEFFAATSQSRAETLAYLDRVYALAGGLLRQAHRASRRDAGERRTSSPAGPSGATILRDGASVACRADGSCVVDGLVDWRNYSAPRKATSTGTARFTLTFARRGGAVTLLGESSTVLERDVRQR